MTVHRVAKLLTRTRGGGVVVSKTRLIKESTEERTEPLVSVRKLRIAGRPNRRAGMLRKG